MLRIATPLTPVQIRVPTPSNNALLAESADAPDLGSGSERSGGSTPSQGTNYTAAGGAGDESTKLVTLSSIL